MYYFGKSHQFFYQAAIVRVLKFEEQISKVGRKNISKR